MAPSATTLDFEAFPFCISFIQRVSCRINMFINFLTKNLPSFLGWGVRARSLRAFSSTALSARRAGSGTVRW